MSESEFLQIHWPETFSVVFNDGTIQPLARGKDGVIYCSVGDDPESRGFIAAQDPRAQTIGRACHLDSIACIISSNGQVLWRAA